MNCLHENIPPPVANAINIKQSDGRRYSNGTADLHYTHVASILIYRLRRFNIVVINIEYSVGGNMLFLDININKFLTKDNLEIINFVKKVNILHQLI